MLTVDIINKLDEDKQRLVETLLFALDYIPNLDIKHHIISILEDINKDIN